MGKQGRVPNQNFEPWHGQYPRGYGFWSQGRVSLEPKWLRMYIYIHIRRPLPELERASLQLQSPMPSNPASPKPSNADTPRGIQASRHPSIPDCRNPLFDHLKGVTAPPSRTPQASTGVHRPLLDADPEPPFPPPWALKLMLPPAQECQIAHWSTLSNPVDPTCHPKPSKQ